MNLAAYSCNTGYNLVGVGTRMCIADGYWSPVAPVCQSELKVKLAKLLSYPYIVNYNCDSCGLWSSG